MRDGASSAHDLGRRAVREIGAVPLARVDHQHAGAPRGVEHALAGRDDGLQRRDIVAERFAEAARLHEIALHVDDEERRRVRLEGELVRLGRNGFLRHGTFRVRVFGRRRDDLHRRLRATRHDTRGRTQPARFGIGERRL
jgi:hypothetical protein